VELRRSLGFKLLDTKVGLLKFASFLQKRRAPRITVQLAMEWAQQDKTMRPAEWAKRLSFVRGFARHWSAHDSQTEVPPCGLLPHRPGRAHPYLYSDNEVLQLLAAAKALVSIDPLRSWTYYCLFGLLAVTGLRLGEALNLRTEDLDWSEGILTIRSAKFGKSRLVPLHASTCNVLADYVKRRDRRFGLRSQTHFFVNMNGNPLDKGEVHRTFYALSRQIGLRAVNASHGPRLHDFRHRFAVETLVQWYRSGEDVERRLPILTTFLGHVHVADTYWYLSACPELMGLAVKRFEDYWEKQS
jgi:integrase